MTTLNILSRAVTSSFDADLANNVIQYGVPVLFVADLAAVVTLSPTLAIAGNGLAYTFAVQNGGGSTGCVRRAARVATHSHLPTAV